MDNHDTGVCGGCGKPKQPSQPVTCIILWATSLERPAVLIPNDKWSLCLNTTCFAARKFISLACQTHPETPDVGENWMHAKIIFDDGFAIQVSQNQPTARA